MRQNESKIIIIIDVDVNFRKYSAWQCTSEARRIEGRRVVARRARKRKERNAVPIIHERTWLQTVVKNSLDQHSVGVDFPFDRFNSIRYVNDACDSPKKISSNFLRWLCVSVVSCGLTTFAARLMRRNATHKCLFVIYCFLVRRRYSTTAKPHNTRSNNSVGSVRQTTVRTKTHSAPSAIVLRYLFSVWIVQNEAKIDGESHRRSNQ